MNINIDWDYAFWIILIVVIFGGGTICSSVDKFFDNRHAEKMAMAGMEEKFITYTNEFGEVQTKSLWIKPNASALPLEARQGD